MIQGANWRVPVPPFGPDRAYHPPAFTSREIAIAWLQQTAMDQARRKYGPAVKTGISRTTDLRILCNYLGLDQRQVLPAAVRQREVTAAPAQADREAGC